MPKKPTTKTLRRKAASVFQRWVCLRDCLAYDPKGLTAPCFTCERVKHFKELQGGHFLAGRGSAILFLEDGCHAQCRQCNCWPDRYGVPAKYEAKMIAVYGEKRVSEIHFLKGQTRDFKLWELQEIYDKYNNLLKAWKGGEHNGTTNQKSKPQKNLSEKLPRLED